MQAPSTHWSQNPAIVLIGAPNQSNVKVSEAISELGLNLLRTSPSQARIVAYPDVNQYRYGDYLHNLLAFLYSKVHNVKTTNQEAVYPLRYVDMAGEKTITKDIPDPKNKGKTISETTTKVTTPFMPFIPPPAILAWTTGHIPEETVQQWRDTLVISEGVSGGKPAIVYRPTTWDGFDRVKGYNVNIRATAPRVTSQPQGYHFLQTS